MTENASLSPIEVLSDFIVRRQPLPSQVRDLSRVLLIDTIGVAIAGSGETAVSILADTVRRSHGGGPSSLFAGGTASAEAAAWVNGTAAHALDFDDVSAAYNGHPSAPVLAATLATAEELDATGADMLEAFAVGIEVSSVLGLWLGHEHYLRGFHTTAVVGALGATAAASRLAKLDEHRVRHALGIAASAAAGLKRNFGSMTKPLHVGNAARTGVESARLAGAGFTAAPDVFSGSIGFLAVYGGAPTVVAHGATARSDAPWLLETPGVALKRYPCCYMLACAVDAAVELRAAGVVPESIERIHVTVAPGGTSAIPHDRPRDGLEAKFSMPYTVAAALVDGRVDLEAFTIAALNRPIVQDLMKCVSYEEDSDPDTRYDGAFAVADAGFARLRIELAGGEVRETTVRFPRGSPHNPLDASEVYAKFVDGAGRVLERQAAMELLQYLREVDRIDSVRELMRRACAGGAN